MTGLFVTFVSLVLCVGGSGILRWIAKKYNSQVIIIVIVLIPFVFMQIHVILLGSLLEMVSLSQPMFSQMSVSWLQLLNYFLLLLTNLKVISS